MKISLELSTGQSLNLFLSPFAGKLSSLHRKAVEWQYFTSVSLMRDSK